MFYDHNGIDNPDTVSIRHYNALFFEQLADFADLIFMLGFRTRYMHNLSFIKITLVVSF